MRVTITPGRLSGAVTPPASKSQCHRLIIAASLARGTSVLHNISPSQDIAATLRCMQALGAVDEGETIQGIPAHPVYPDLPLLNCGESGSTLRFLVPVALAVAGGGVFTGQGRLMERPMEPYEDICRQQGIRYDRTPEGLRVRGTLHPGIFELPGDVSSQFITGLLFALPLLGEESEIVLTSRLQSAGYVEMTLDALQRFGVQVETTKTGWRIPGNQHYRPQTLTAEGDWSQAAFWLSAGMLGSPVMLRGMDPKSIQGDRIIQTYCRRLSGEGPVALDVGQCPDLAPALALIAALRTGELTLLVNAGRLRLKESDRIESITAALSALGAKITADEDSMSITGVARLSGGVCQSWNDHRIAMMLAIAATRAASPVTILGAECVAKSYPKFWADYAALGGQFTEESP